MYVHTYFMCMYIYIYKKGIGFCHTWTLNWHALPFRHFEYHCAKRSLAMLAATTAERNGRATLRIRSQSSFPLWASYKWDNMAPATLYIHIYVHICISLYVSIHICIYIYIFINNYTYIYIYTCIYIFIYYIYIYLYVCMYVYSLRYINM